MRNEQRVHELLNTARGAHHSLIVIQDVPDPDAIASAEALKRLLAHQCGAESVIAHEGIAARAENRGLLRYLDLKLAQISQLRLEEFDLVATVDTQPQFTNNSLPSDVHCTIVIDHHPSEAEQPAGDFVDIRPMYGAASTILTEYLRLSGTPIDVPLATALLYGIKSDTQDLGRESTKADTDAYLFLYLLADKAALSRIEHQSVPRGYFQTLHKALEGSRVYGPALICYTGRAESPETIAEVADLLLRLENVTYVLCYGVAKDELLVSLRTSKTLGNAHGLMREILEGIGSGGGHDTIAGGRVPLARTNIGQVARILEERFLARLHLSAVRPERLVEVRE